jgi:OOP family OmpA-OmpF porin
MRLATAFAAALSLLAFSSAAFAHGHGVVRFYWTPFYPYATYPYATYPYYVYRYPAYPPPPIVVERRYVPVAPRAPQYSYDELHAQAAAPQPQPAPRMERITLAAQELFEFDRATLRSPQPRLDQIAEVMIRNPQIERVTITGYTDRIGTASYNLELSRLRAEAVKRYLAAKGVAGSRLVAVGKGKANPVVQCNDKKMADLIRCLAPNRRVEVEEISIERRAR